MAKYKYFFVKGRAGRPQFDDQGTAVIMVHDVKKHFYKKFLYEPFPVESSLLGVLADHLNAEIVASTIGSKQEAVDYLTWTYFFRRLLVNPSYYELESLDHTQINQYLSQLVKSSIKTLEDSYCVTIGENGELNTTTFGRIASFYYLSHLTLKMFKETMSDDVDVEVLIDILSMSKEFEEFPVRHNEDKLNAELSNEVPLKVNSYTYDSPHTKVNLLLQAHFTRVTLPITDYITDTKSVLDQCLRVMQAILDFSAEQGWLNASLSVINLMQMACQARWFHDSCLLTLPHIETEHLARFLDNKNNRIDCLPRLIDYADKNGYKNVMENMLGDLLDKNQIRDVYQVLSQLPQIELEIRLNGDMPAGEVIQRKTGKKETNPDGSDKCSKNLRIDLLNEKKIYDLYENEDYVIHLDLKRLHRARNEQGFKAYAPKYPKSKDENWIFVLGLNYSAESSELIGLKRLNSFKMAQKSYLAFKTPSIESNSTKNKFELTLYLMSDVYLGLDQQYELNFNLKSK